MGSTTPLIPQVPDRFLGFNRGTVGIVEGVNFGNYPNYILLNASLCRTIFGMAGDTFLTGNAAGSTGSGQVPWVLSTKSFDGDAACKDLQETKIWTRLRRCLWMRRLALWIPI